MKAAFFYTDDEVVSSKDLGWLQSEFDLLKGLFDRMGLRTNICKTAGMVFQPCRADRVRADKAYTRRIMGEGTSFKEQQRKRVTCPECGKELEKGSLVTHLQTQHGVAKGRLGS